MLRKSLAVASVVAASTALTIAPASAEFSQTIGSDRCNVTATGPTFKIDTLPKPAVVADGALGASIYCPI